VHRRNISIALIALCCLDIVSSSIRSPTLS